MFKFYLSTDRGLLGAPFGLPATRQALDMYVAMLGECPVPWAVSVVGGDVVDSGLAQYAVELGGHIHLGLEFFAGERTPTNVELIAEAVAVCDALGVPVATPDQAAEILGLPRAALAVRAGRRYGAGMSESATPGAVFFDLDRTLLGGASGPVISASLRRSGLMPERSLPGEGLVFRLFDLIGETRPSMMLTRQAVKAAKGWDREATREAGRHACEQLAAAVQPCAKVIIDEHRAAGDRW